MIRSSASGVPHDIGAAYATLASRTGDLLAAIDGSRLALPADERDRALLFAQRARRVRGLTPETDDKSLCEAILQIFELTLSPFPSTSSGQAGAQDDTIKLTDRVEPEQQSGVQAWTKHFSASALNAYSECARKWFYRYACAAVEDPGSSASAYGTAFHLALEDFHGDFPRPSADDEQQMRRRVRECVTWAFERNRDGFATRVEFELQVRRAQRTAQRYVDWLLVQEREAPFEVLGREVPAEVDMGGRAFVGYIDRLDRDQRSGGSSVVDYKTGSIATSSAEYADKVRRFRDFQLPFYYWARTAEGDNVTKLVLIPLKDALLDVRPVVLEVGKTIAVNELEKSRTRMIELATQLASGEVAAFEPTTNPAACTFCAYERSCNGKPWPEPERFGS